MHWYESWTVKKAECQRIDAFELWCWRTLESPLGCKEIQPVHPKGDQSWEGLMLKLKLQFFGHLMWRTDSLENTLMLEKIEGRSRRGRQRMKWLGGITNSMDMSLSKAPGVGDGQGSLGVLQWGHKKSTRLSVWTELNWTCEHLFSWNKGWCGTTCITSDLERGAAGGRVPAANIWITPKHASVKVVTFYHLTDPKYHQPSSLRLTWAGSWKIYCWVSFILVGYAYSNTKRRLT